jgi:hypothetical protein
MRLDTVVVDKAITKFNAQCVESVILSSKQPCEVTVYMQSTRIYVVLFPNKDEALTFMDKFVLP